MKKQIPKVHHVKGRSTGRPLEDVNIYQVKLLSFYNVQTTNLKISSKI